MSDFTVLVQGPYYWEMLNKNLPHYLDIGKVVVSTYNECLKECSEDFLLCGDVKYVLSPPETKPHFKHSVNLFNQAYTSYNGGCVVDTEFVIKVRSDESWGNLEPLCEKIVKNPEKYTSCNIFFDKTLYHPSDHCYGMRTKNFVHMHENVLKACYLGKDHNHIHLNSKFLGLPQHKNMITEAIFGLSFLQVVGYDNNELKLNNSCSSELMKRNFEVVDIDDMVPYLWRWNSGPQNYPKVHTSSEYLYPPYNNCIRKVHEL